MNKIIVRKIITKIALNILMLLSIISIIVLLTKIPLDLDFTYIDGELTSNMDFTLYKEEVFNSIRLLVTGDYLQMTIGGRWQTVGEIMSVSLRRSMTVFFLSLILAVVIGVLKGIFDSRRGKKPSTIKFLQTIIPLSVPDVLTISLVQMFAYYLYQKEVSLLGLGPIPHGGSGHWTQGIYPVIALSLVPAAYIARITATSIETAYNKDYIRAARGKGCSELRIILNHAMRTVWADLIASFPAITSLMFSSLFIVERIFYYPGIAYEMIELYGRPTELFLKGGRVADGSSTGIAYLAFAVSLAVIYFILYTLLDIVKQVLVPKLRH